MHMVKCLQNNRDIGVFVWATNTGAFSDKVIINIKWLGAVGGAPGQLENGIQIDGADLPSATKTIPTSWQDKEVVSLIINPGFAGWSGDFGRTCGGSGLKVSSL